MAPCPLRDGGIESRPAVRRSPVGLDVRVREQEPHHLEVADVRRENQRRGPDLRRLVDLDVLAREQEPHHLDVAFLRQCSAVAPSAAASLTSTPWRASKELHHVMVQAVHRLCPL